MGAGQGQSRESDHGAGNDHRREIDGSHALAVANVRHVGPVVAKDLCPKVAKDRCPKVANDPRRENGDSRGPGASTSSDQEVCRKKRNPPSKGNGPKVSQSLKPTSRRRFVVIGQNPQKVDGKAPSLTIEKGQNRRIEKGQNRKIGKGQNLKIEKGQNRKIGNGQNLKIGNGPDLQIAKGRNLKIAKGLNLKTVSSQYLKIVSVQLLKIAKEINLQIVKSLLSDQRNDLDPSLVADAVDQG